MNPLDSFFKWKSVKIHHWRQKNLVICIIAESVSLGKIQTFTISNQMEQKKKRIECSLLWLHNNSYCKIKMPIHLSKDDYIIVIEFCGINSGYHEAIWPKKRKWIFGVVVLMTVVFKKNNGVRRWWSVTDNDGGAISCLQVINCFPPDSRFGK